jgi:hypothetical protein
LGRRIKDILSGVKIFPAYLLQVGCKSLLLIDKFGDVALFGIARKYKLNLLSIPCNYRKRGYGKSSIKRWSGGVVILRATIHLYFHRCFK